MPAARRGAITGAFANDNNNNNSNNTGPSTSVFNNSSNNNNNSGNMAFTFGQPAPAPGAPAPAGGFGFGAAATPAPGAPAPAAGAFGSFGAPAAAPGAPAAAPTFGAPATPSTFGSFGTKPGTPAPAPFGAPAPATGAFGFGAKAPTPAFGSPAPAPGTGGLFGAGSFGSTTTPAPTTGGLFGAQAPAFGAAPTPATGLFSGASQPAAQPGHAMPTLLGSTPYAALPPHEKQIFDSMYNEIMAHQRTMCHVETMRPRLLEKKAQQADAAAGQELPLTMTVQEAYRLAQELDLKLKDLREKMLHEKGLYEKTAIQATKFAKWPTEATAARLGITLTTKPIVAAATPEQEKKDSAFLQQLQGMLDREMTRVDQIQMLPSPYLWQTLQEMEERCEVLHGQLQSLKRTLDSAKDVTADDFNVVSVMEMQEQAIYKVGAELFQASGHVDQVRHMYNRWESGVNVLEQAKRQEEIYEQNVQYQMNRMQLQKLPASTTAPAPATGGFGAPAPATGGLFGAPSTGGLFSAPAPAAGSSLFGKAPAPAGGSLFGSTPAPAPTTGVFGATPAPAPGGFGATPAPGAPAPSAFGTPATGSLFGSTGASTPAPAGGLSFGTPAAASAGGAPAMPSFGAPAGAPSSTPLFANPTATTPKSKNKSRSGTRRR